MTFFKTLLDSFFNNNKELVYTAFNNKDHFRAIAKLKSNGINFTIKNLIRQSDTPVSLPIKEYKSRVHYEIYVKKEDVNKASSVINRK